MDRARLAPALLSLLAFGCRSAESAPGRAPASAAPPPGCTLVFLETGPKSGQLSKDENDRAFVGHFSNMQRMAAAGQLLVAGPFGEQRHDPALRGLFVLATADRDEARRWAETDPTTQAGIFTLEFHDLATTAPLAAARERDLDRIAQARAAGRTPEPGAGARPYVLLTAEHGDVAERELGGLMTAEGGVFLLGRLDGSRALALLDSANIEEARVRFAPQLENVGAHTLDEWFASGELAGMVH